MQHDHRRGGVSRLRLAAYAWVRRTYVGLAEGRFARVVELGPVQRLRERLRNPMHLRDVEDILGVLSGAGVRWWLAGGWGVDALVGRQTRRHKDLDLIISGADLERAVAALAAHRFAPVPEDYPGAGRRPDGTVLPARELLQDPAARIVDLHPVDVDGWAAAIGVVEAFATGSLGNGPMPCMSLAAQMAAHEGIELRDEHRANVRLVQALLAESPG